MVAAGAYLWFTREHYGKSRADAAKYVREQTGEGTTDVQVMRIEKGQRTKAEVLAALTDFVDGNPIHVHSLLTDKDATEERARELARAWVELDRSERQRIKHIAATTDPEVLRSITAALRKADDDVSLRAALEALLNGRTLH